MTVVAGRPAAISAETNAAVVIFRFLASLKLAVGLIATLAVVLAVATIVETERGRDYAQWYVYHSSWFVTLLGLLGVNILAATLVRFPWKKKWGFLITHVGLLVLLAGAILTFLRGIDAQLLFEEGETTRRIVFHDHSRQFTARWQDPAGRPTSTEAVFNFQPGPRDWPDGQTRDLGPCEAIQLKVLKFYSHARVDETWLDDVAQRGGPALRFAFSGPDGTAISEDWLVAEQFGARAAIGPAQLELQQIREPALLEDFLHPATGDAGKQGLLAAHYQGKTVRIPVGANLGKKVPVGESGAAVELVQYLANAKPGPGGRFVAGGEEPINPFLELRVHLPGAKEPVRQIAFANLPFLNLDAVHGRVCPVKFWYHHPAVTASPGAEFLQTPDGKLYCRIGAGGKYQSRGVVKEGDQIQLAGRFKLTLARYLPHARQQVSFQPLEVAPGESGGPEAAALVEVAAGGRTQQVWLKRNDPTYGTRILATDQAALTLGFGSEFQPLDFSLKLVKFKHGLNPGGMGDASFASSVQVIDPKFHVDQTREISMNEPLTYGGLTFYQSGFDSAEGRDVSILSVAYDPGLTAKYLGCAMICLGTFIMFFPAGFAVETNRRMVWPPAAGA